MDIEELILKLQNPSNMRLMMGELTSDELLVAQSAVRYTVTQLTNINFIPSE